MPSEPSKADTSRGLISIAVMHGFIAEDGTIPTVSGLKRSREITENIRRPLTNRKIGIFGKGGAGKSTATGLLARTLPEADKH